jgi:hypothetical protein
MTTPARLARLADHIQLPEPQLRFAAGQPDAVDVHPLRGLLTFGAHSAVMLAPLLPAARIALIAPRADQGRVMSVFQQLRSPASAGTHRYVPDYPGFTQVYGADLVPADDHVHVWIENDHDARITEAADPQAALAAMLSIAASHLYRHRSEFHVAAIYLPDRWSAGFTGPGQFDLHHYAKAVFASLGIPSQLLRQRLFGRPAAEVSWTLSVAIYTKLGGTPWVLAGSMPRVAYVGLSYAIRDQAAGKDEPGATATSSPTRAATGRAQGRFVTCCSQLFEGDGSGLEFTVYDTAANQVQFDGDNPFLSRDAMRAVVARTLSMHAERHAGARPERVVVHKTTHFTDDEVAGATDALAGIPDVDLLQVQEDVAWRAIALERGEDGKGAPAAYPAQRGSLLVLDDYAALLWTQGNAPEAVGGRGYYKEGVGIPRPLLLRRWLGTSPAESVSAEVLGLSKMNFNNDALYDLLPVTIKYAGILAQVVKRMPRLQARPYPLRLFI